MDRKGVLGRIQLVRPLHSVEQILAGFADGNGFDPGHLPSCLAKVHGAGPVAKHLRRSEAPDRWISVGARSKKNEKNKGRIRGSALIFGEWLSTKLLSLPD